MGRGARRARDRGARADAHASSTTALYHALLAPSVAGDADGRYRGPDDQVHRAEGFTFRSTFSLWDTFRAEHPLLTLVQPERAQRRHRPLADRQPQQVSPYGILPVWQFQGRETWTMIGYHAVPVIADAYLKGIRGFDADAALDAMVASATYAPYGGLGDYMKLGYVPIDREPEAASKTVEYAYDDWTIARMARAMGRTDVAATLREARRQLAQQLRREDRLRARAQGRRQLPRPRSIRPRSTTARTTPRAMPGNIQLVRAAGPGRPDPRCMGGDAAAVAKLDAMFDYDNSKLDYSHAEDIAGLIGQYIHGNEPSHHVAYLYVYAGAPWRTQERLKQIVESQYKPTPDGLSGNDDLGPDVGLAGVHRAWASIRSRRARTNMSSAGRSCDRAALNLPNGQAVHGRRRTG